MKRSYLVASGLVLLPLIGAPVSASAGEGVAGAANVVSSQITATARNEDAVIGLNKDFRMFATAAAAYVYANVGDAPWNQPDSTTPIIYVPIDMYAGNNPAQCDFPAVSGEVVPGVSGPINLFGSVPAVPAPSTVTSSAWATALPDYYLPSISWKPPFGGTDCAVAYLNEPAAEDYGMVTYYVAPSGTRSVVNNLTITKAMLAAQASAALGTNPPTNSTPLYYAASSSTVGAQ
ncbi:MAG: hypothetical protein PHI71_01540 [Acidiphilium sp.]|nr:hypothetical protein [Acidiphilium sp.]